MIRKWMALVLSLMLTMMLPLGAMADTQHTLTIVPGELLASEQAIADLLDVVDLRVTEGDRSGALTVLLNDQALVTLGLTADTTGLYAASEVLGADVLYVTWDDAFAMLTDLMKANLAQAGADAAAVQALESSMAETKNSIVTALGSGMTVAPQVSTPATFEESLALVEKMFPDDPKMVEYIKGLYEDMTIEDGSFADEERDTADQKYRMTMDEEDLVAVCDTAYMESILLETLAAENPDATEEELAKAADEVVAEVKKLYEDSGFEMIMEMYTLDAGQTLVGMDMIMNMSIDATETEGEELKTSMQMAAVYDRLTDAEGVSHKADAAMAVDSSVVEVDFDLYRANSGKSEGMLGMLADGEEIIFTYEAENVAADTRVRGVALYMRSGATAILEPAAADRPVISFVIKTEPASEETLAALENANADNSVNVLKLSDAEMQTLSNTIMTNGMQVFYTALGQLPTSTLNLLMNSTGMAE